MNAQDLITAEVARQDRMWGALNERADTSKGQLLNAGMAQAILVDAKERNPGYAETRIVAKIAESFYPPDWSGFRSYGSDVANLVVAAAFLHQEIKRRLTAGEDTTRTSRDIKTQPYGENTTPAVIEP